MRDIDLFPPGSEETACHWVKPLSWKDQVTTHYVSGANAGQVKDASGPSCTRCSRSSKRSASELTSKPIKDKGDPAKGRLLVLLSYTSYGESVAWMTAQIRALGYEGSIYYDLVIRCGTGDITDSQIAKCRPYLAYTFSLINPDRVLLCGPAASKAFLGKSIASYHNRMNWQLIDSANKDRRIPLMATFEPDTAMTNKFYGEFFRDEVKTLLTYDWSREPLLQGTAKCVETQTDVAEFEGWLAGAEFVSFDCETVGLLFDPGFRVASIAFSRPDSDDVYVFMNEIVAAGWARAAITRALTGPVPKSGTNLRYDCQSVWCMWGIEVSPIYGDLRLEYKVTNPAGMADLQSLAQMIGIGHHKREAEEELSKLKKDLRAFKRLSSPDGEVPKGYRPESEAYGLLSPTVHGRYVGRDAYSTARAHVWARRNLEAIPELMATYRRLVLPAMSELMWVERNGVLVDRAMISMCEYYFNDRITTLDAELKDEWGIDASDADSIRAFFEEKGIWSPKWEKTKTGKVSTDARALKLVKSQHEAVGRIIDFRKLTKLMQSYVQTLPIHIRPDDRVHPSVLQETTKSARLSMRDPGMMQIPSRGGEPAFMVKSCFVARDGHTLVCADYKTLEIFIAAILSKDDSMISTLASGLDYHLETTKRIALQAWGVTPEQVVAEFEAGDEYRRGIGKTLNFGVLYGQGPAAVAEAVNTTEQVAKVLLDSLFGAYPALRRWIQACKREARETGYTYAYWNGEVSRRRPVFDAGFPDSARRGHDERAAFNNRIQSTASDICLASVVELSKFFRANSWPAQIALTIHDSIIVECRDDIADDVQAKMDNVMTGWPTGDLKLKASFKRGPVWGSVQ